MRYRQALWSAGIVALLAGAGGTAGILGPVTVFAHEDHAPLPTKGVTVAGNNILLSEKARKAIGLTTVEITFGDLHRTVEVNARAELPWNQQAMITSLVPGRIEQVLVRPGESVGAGQELARLASMELESLQLGMAEFGHGLHPGQVLGAQPRLWSPVSDSCNLARGAEKGG